MNKWMDERQMVEIHNALRVQYRKYIQLSGMGGGR